MKKIILYLYFLLIITNINAQNEKCSRTTFFGTKEICLPNLKGYKECYLDTLIKENVDNLEILDNKVLGFYLNEDIYEKRDSIGAIIFDDYFKIYGTKKIQNFNANKSTLDEMKELLKGNFLSENWDEVNKEIDKLNINVEIGKPITVKNYTLNESSFTYICLIKYSSEEDSYFVATAVNGILIKDRLIWLAYYLDYLNEKSINELERKII